MEDVGMVMIMTTVSCEGAKKTAVLFVYQSALLL